MSDNNNNSQNSDPKKKIAFACHYVVFAAILTMAIIVFCGEDMALLVNRIMVGIVLVILFRVLWNIDERKPSQRIFRSAVLVCIFAVIGYLVTFVAFPGMKTMAKGIFLSFLLLISFLL